ncbi:hypothetical protein JCM18382A_26730 [Bradyrhizobium sp. 17-4]
MARQIDAVAERGGGLGACRDDGQVEDGKRDHGRQPSVTSRGDKDPGRAGQSRSGKLEEVA